MGSVHAGTTGRPGAEAAPNGRGLAPRDVRERLLDVIDPELGVNIVDLGLLYDVTVDDELVTVTMTTTTPACPLGPYFAGAVQAALHDLVAGRQVRVDLVWRPPWTPDHMSATARAQLGHGG